MHHLQNDKLCNFFMIGEMFETSAGCQKESKFAILHSFYIIARIAVTQSNYKQDLK